MKNFLKYWVLPSLVGVGIFGLAGGIVYGILTWDIALYVVVGSIGLGMCWLMGAVLLSGTRWWK